jgi:hypothetical protein
LLRTCGECEAATGGAAQGTLGDGQIDHPAGALGEIGGVHAGADLATDALGEGVPLENSVHLV